MGMMAFVANSWQQLGRALLHSYAALEQNLDLSEIEFIL